MSTCLYMHLSKHVETRVYTCLRPSRRGDRTERVSVRMCVCVRKRAMVFRIVLRGDRRSSAYSLLRWSFITNVSLDKCSKVSLERCLSTCACERRVFTSVFTSVLRYVRASDLKCVFRDVFRSFFRDVRASDKRNLRVRCECGVS